MSDQDLVSNAIYDGIKRGITVCLDNKCLGSAQILLFAGMDAMACLSLPTGQVEVTGPDFIRWCDKYIHLSGGVQIPGEELYSARCAMLHTYGVDSRLTRRGKARRLIFVGKTIPEVIYSPKVEPDLVIVSTDALANAFFAAIDKCVIDLFSDPATAKLTEERLQWMMAICPVPELKGGQ
jgi:ribosomal protein L25 (general stress protein Ctc)